VKMSHIAIKAVGVSTLALVLGGSVLAAPQDNRRRGEGDYRGSLISTQGRITDIRREGGTFRVMLDRNSYPYFVPVATVRNRNLHVGDDVRLGGYFTGGVVNVDTLAYRGEADYNADGNYRNPARGSVGSMTGVVQRVDRKLGYLVIREDGGGRDLRIDVRHMNLRKPVNVWGIHAGDHITVRGTWEDRDTFDARRVEY
jgi:hypothetical protein